MANRLPKDVQAAVERLEPRLRAAFMQAIQNVTSAIRLIQLEEMIRAGNVEGAIDALRLEQGFFGPLYEAHRESYITGGGLILSEVKVKDPFDGSRFVIGFDGRAVRAERWVQEQSSRLITEIIEDQRDMARAVIREGLEQGQNPRTTALEIAGRVNRATGQREGGFIGLTSQQAAWVRNAEAELRGLDAGYFDRAARDKRYDGTIRKAIDSGKALSGADVARIVRRYKDRLLKARADLIAENESLTALRAGQMEGLRQLVDTGKVRDDQIERTWSDTGDGRTRPAHRAMRGQKVRGVNEPFVFPDGTRALFPGDVSLGAPAKNTIRCRCVATTRIRYDELRG